MLQNQFLLNINPNIELPKYELVLTKLNEEPITSLKNIENFEIKAYFANIDEISFRIPFYRTDTDGTQVKNELFILGEEFNREEREGDFGKDGKKKGYTKKFYSKLLEMGTFEELIDIFLDMKKNGVVMN